MGSVLDVRESCGFDWVSGPADSVLVDPLAGAVGSTVGTGIVVPVMASAVVPDWEVE
jgi:dihydrodipicolinate synthase/N-acetylneuraminate lyase